MAFIHSTIGKKIVVALTGLILFGFVIGHLLGNLQVFLGPKAVNDYAVFLSENLPLLWGTRVTLLISVLLHVIYTVDLTRRNRRSRPVAYSSYKPVKAGFSSRFMIWSGVFLGLYVIYHVLHLTFGVAHPGFVPLDIYSNIVRGFSVWHASLLYILAMIALGFHLNHGVRSVFQTLGLNHPKYNGWRRCLSFTAAVVIPAGYISIPVAVMAGLLR